MAPTLDEYQQAVDAAKAHLDQCRALQKIATDVFNEQMGRDHPGGAGTYRGPIPGYPNCTDAQKAYDEAKKRLDEANRGVEEFNTAPPRGARDLNEMTSRIGAQFREKVVQMMEDALATAQTDERLRDIYQRILNQDPTVKPVLDEAMKKLEKDQRGMFAPNAPPPHTPRNP